MSANHAAITSSADTSDIGDDLPAVTRVSTAGPLGPWRLSASVLAAAVTSGPQLVAATSTGHELDQALGRSLAVASVTWVLLGVINRILARTAVADDAASSSPDDADVHPTV